MEPSRSWYYAGLATVFVIALALRLALTACFEGLTSPPNASATTDQVDYELLAFRLSTGQGYTWESGEPTAAWPPGTSFALVPLYVLVGRSFLAARLWFCLLSALTCPATAWLARQCFGRRVALLAAAWLAFYPGHFYYAMHLLSEVPFDLCLALAGGFAVAGLKKRSWAWGVLAGLCWGFAVLTRPAILPAVPFFGLFALLAVRKAGRTPLLQAALQSAVVLAVLAPWVSRNALVMGRPVVTLLAGGYTFWGAHNDRVLQDPDLCGYWVPVSEVQDAAHPLTGSEAEREAAAWRNGMEFVTTHPADMPRLEAMKLWRFLGPALGTPNRAVYWSFTLGWLLTAPFVVGGLMVAVRREGVAAAVLAAPLLGALASAIVFCGCDRYRDALAPVFLIFAAQAADALVRSLAQVRPAPASPKAADLQPGASCDAAVC
jgi:4-amino-4-deoxy-L-arabinose transferase-like glycosyltransferase